MLHPTAEKIVAAAGPLFATKGFKGVSVREICSAAGVSSNSVNYYFETKQGLFRHIIERFGSDTLRVIRRILDKPAASHEDFLIRMEMVVTELLESFLNQKDLVAIVFEELPRVMTYAGGMPTNFPEMALSISRFVEQAQTAGYVRTTIAPSTVAGIVLDRIGNQVRFELPLKQLFDIDIHDPTYQKQWVAENFEILMHGVSSSKE